MEHKNIKAKTKGWFQNSWMKITFQIHASLIPENDLGIVLINS
jgi:hypothetical protein